MESEADTPLLRLETMIGFGGKKIVRWHDSLTGMHHAGVWGTNHLDDRRLDDRHLIIGQEIWMTYQ